MMVVFPRVIRTFLLILGTRSITIKVTRMSILATILNGFGMSFRVVKSGVAGHFPGDGTHQQADESADQQEYFRRRKHAGEEIHFP